MKTIDTATSGSPTADLLSSAAARLARLARLARDGQEATFQCLDEALDVAVRDTRTPAGALDHAFLHVLHALDRRAGREPDRDLTAFSFPPAFERVRDHLTPLHDDCDELTLSDLAAVVEQAAVDAAW